MNRTVTRARGSRFRGGLPKVDDKQAAGRATKTVILGPCKHDVDYGAPLPKRGDLIWCHKCRDYRVVLLLQSSFKAKCRDCQYSRTFGRAMFAADKAARRHTQKMGHTVDRYDGSALQWTSTVQQEELTLELPSDDPPY